MAMVRLPTRSVCRNRYCSATEARAANARLSAWFKAAADSAVLSGYDFSLQRNTGLGQRSPPKREDVMGIESIVVWLIVGAIAGWLAGQIVTGYGFGLIGNIVVGIVGAVIAGFLLPQLGLGLPAGIVGAIIYAVIGAVILLVIIGLFRR
jgi:uncharacterized membrane protein YeaQ/YmgE (transglycosylase-associated protein family)